MKKIMITGSNGLLGQKLTRVFAGRPDFECLATSRGENRALLHRRVRYQSLDITDSSAVSRIISEFRPETVIHTAALSQVDVCEKNPDLAWQINVLGTEHFVHACAKYNAHLIYFSSDFIFDGQNGPYRESAVPHPLNQYGRTKRESEKMLQKSAAPWTILRTCLVYGIAVPLSRANILTWVRQSLENRQAIRAVTDQIRTPTLIDDLADACFRAVLQKSQGIYHISGEESMSVFDLAIAIADFFKLDRSLIRPVETRKLNEPAVRPPKTGFVVDKAKNELGFKPHSLREGLTRLKKSLAALHHPERSLRPFRVVDPEGEGSRFEILQPFGLQNDGKEKL